MELARKRESWLDKSWGAGSAGSDKIMSLRSFCMTWIYFCVHMERVIFGRSKSEDLGVNRVSDSDRNRRELGRHGSPHAHTLGNRGHSLQEAFWKATGPSRTSFHTTKINPKQLELGKPILSAFVDCFLRVGGYIATHPVRGNPSTHFLQVVLKWRWQHNGQL